MAKKEIIFTVVIMVVMVTVGLLIQLYYMQNSQIIDPGPVSRIYLARGWLEAPVFPISLDKSPLYLHVMAGIISLVRLIGGSGSGAGLIQAEILGLRLFSLGFSLLLLAPYFKLVKLVFNERIAVYSTFFLVVYPTYIRMSTVPYEMAVFLFFIFTFLFLIFRFKATGRRYDLLVASLALFVSSMLRPESWIMIPIFAAAMIAWKRYKLLPLFLGIGLAYPVLLMAASYYYSRDPLHYLSRNDQSALITSSYIGASVFNRIMAWPTYFHRNLPWFSGWLILAGLGYSIVKKRCLALGLIAGIFLSVYICKTLRLTLNVREHYSLLIGLLLLPYAGLVIDKLVSLNRKAVLVLTILFLLLTGAFSVKQAMQVYPEGEHSQMPAAEKELTQWIAANIKEDNFVLIATDNLDIFGVILYSGADFSRRQVITTWQLRIKDELGLERLGFLLKNKKLTHVIIADEWGDQEKLNAFIGLALNDSRNKFFKYELLPWAALKGYSVYKTNYSLDQAK